MEKIQQGMKKNYKVINIVILCICIYILVFYPMVSNLLETISPNLTKCPYLSLTGKPCPLCGGTRFMKNIKYVFVDINYIFNFFGLVLLILVLEIIYRTINLIKNEERSNVIKIDIGIHIFLIIGYLIYSIYFLVK